MFQKISNLDERKRFLFDLGVILAFSILVTLPIFFMGLPGGIDMPQHFQFAQTFNDSLVTGEIYPSWAIQPNGGNGDIGIRFYPPLTYYVFTLFKAISGNWFDGFCLSIVLFYFLGGFGVYLWAREWFSRSASLFGAITYIFLPNHVNQVYGAGMYAEFAAASIIPFCFLFTYKVCRNGRLTDVLGLAVFYGLLVLTHLPLTVICSIALLFYALFSLKKLNYIKAILKLSVSVLTGLLLSCFYWSRMVTELDFVNHNSDKFSTGYFSFQSNFLLSKYFAFTGATVSGTSSFDDKTLFISLAILISAAVIYFVKTRETKNFQIKNAAVLVALALFMSMPLSINIWQSSSILQKTQFPWRWLTVIELGTALFAAAAFGAVMEYLKTSKRYLAIIGIGTWLVCVSFNVTEVMNPLITYPKDYFNSVVGRWKAMPSHECWWTVWATPSGEKGFMPVSQRLPGKVVIENRDVNIEKWDPTERIFNIGEGTGGQATVATFYYPLWKATINGQPAELTPNENGLMTFSVSPGSSDVRIYFQEPLFVIASFYASGFMWIIVLGILILGAFRSFPFNKNAELD